MNQYRVYNTNTQESKTVLARNEQEAVEKACWFVGWCQVHKITMFDGIDQ